MSELLDKQVNAQKESLKKLILQTHKKCAMKKKKQCAGKNVIDGRREFIGHMWKSSS